MTTVLSVLIGGLAVGMTFVANAGEVAITNKPTPSEDALLQRINRAVDLADHATKQGAAQGRAGVNAERIPRPLPVPPSTSSVDPEAIARRLTPVVGQPPMAVAPTLYAFVSFSMPRASLQRLVADAETYGATLVLRGLVNRSLKTTAKTAQDLIGRHKVGWLVDPHAFKRFGIRSVPSYVLVRTGAVGQPCELRTCYSEADYVRLSSDVTVRYALDKMDDFAPDFRADVATLVLREGRQ